ncbi:alkaline phosphatase [Bacteroidota bacterium]
MNFNNLTKYSFLVIFLILASCSGNTTQEKPINIILMIGDGMGTSHIYAGMMANGGHLNLEKCEYVGFQKTYSANSDITDSGASATALASGIKTLNGAIGVDPNGVPVITILELAEENGLSTGLLATSTITHATPAAFAAHNPDRGEYEEIALDISQSNVDLIIGGGRYHFSRREDGQNLLEKMTEQGYFIADELDDVPGSHSGPVAVFSDSLAMPSINSGRGDLLVRSTEFAVNRLSNNLEGFFLMVEGSQIDWEAHGHRTQGVVAEMLDFDEAVGKALDFAEKDGNTLVVVTADHETGGFNVLEGGPKNPEIEGAFTTDGHTGVMVPVFAYGPGSEEFAGIYENTMIFEKMKNLLDF